MLPTYLRTFYPMCNELKAKCELKAEEKEGGEPDENPKSPRVYPVNADDPVEHENDSIEEKV